MYIELIDGEKYASKNPNISDSPDDFKDAGYLIEDNEIVVDIDCLDRNALEALIALFNIKTQIEWTDRGVHLYYKKPKGVRKHSGMTPLGINVEVFYKKGNQLYTPICCKRNGVKRVVENPGVRDDFPEIFKFGTYDDLLGMEEGEERNNAMYKHKKRIRRLNDWRKILTFINNNIFATPLDQEEFQQVTRDQGLDADKTEEYDMAEYLLRELGAVNYVTLFVRNTDGNYTNDEAEINRLVYQYCPGKNTRYVEEIVKQMRFRAPKVSDNQEFKIKFRNGYLYQGEFFECEYRGFTPYVIDVDYDPDAEPVAEVDNYLDQLSNGDKDYRNRLIEIISHCFVVNKEFKRLLSKFHVIRGSGGNGKGTFLQVIKAILGRENCSALSIKQMADERYFFNMVGKLANLGDDIHNAPINDDQMKIIKNITTCDPVEIRKMRENSTTEEMVITLIFTSNHIIKSFEKSEAYKRRVDWLPIFSKPKKKDRQFITKLTTPKALNYWIRLAVEGYYRLYKKQDFTKCAIIDDFNKEYHEENDNTLTFVRDLTRDQIIGKKPPEIYKLYETWCEDNGDDPLSKKTLRETIQKKHGLIVKAQYIKKVGRTVKVYQIPRTEKELKMLL